MVALPCVRDSHVFFFFNDTATTEIYTLFPTRRSSDLCGVDRRRDLDVTRPQPERRSRDGTGWENLSGVRGGAPAAGDARSEEHTSELQSRQYLVCRLLLEKKKKSKPFKTS